MACEIYRSKKGRPPKKGKATDSLEGIKFNWKRFKPGKPGRPKKKTKAGL